MRLLAGHERISAERFLDEAAAIAARSCCHRAQCGAVVVKDGEIAGRGWNSPPGDTPLESCRKDRLPLTFKSDRTCCVHAEQRAIHDALANHADPRGATLYFVRVVDGGIVRDGHLYCTICSKEILDAGLAGFVMWQPQGPAFWDATEMNARSFGD